jgi:nucleoside-diphosphate-sugar epimerase
MPEDNTMQTILGANGIIGVGLAKSLLRFTDSIRLVSRNPRKVNQSDQTFSADLTSAEQALKGVEGSTVAYLTVGLRYNLEVWRTKWPLIMKNVIGACKKHDVKLVFFDNVYLYGRVNGSMTEDTPVNPVSRKGEVRAEIARMLMEEVRQGNIRALIARSADFYGPDTPLSFVNAMVFENFRKGKKAQWMINDRARHSFTYTPDAGNACAILGNSEQAFNQVWHLPTDKNALTGREFIEAAAKAFGVDAHYTTFPRWMMRAIGLFNGIIRESIEMLYQYDSDYLFDSGKFDKAFGVQATPYQKGIEETAKSMK